MVAFSRPLDVQDDLLDGVGFPGFRGDAIGLALARRSAAAYAAVDTKLFAVLKPDLPTSAWTSSRPSRRRRAA